MRHVLNEIRIPLPWFAIILGTIIGIIFTSLDYSHTDWTFADYYRYKLPLHFLLNVVAFIGIIALLSLSKHIFAIFFTPLLLLCSIQSYYFYTQQITVNVNLIDAMFNTEPASWGALIPRSLIFLTIAIIIFGGFVSYLRFKHTFQSKRYFWSILSVAIILNVISFAIPSVRYSLFTSHVPFSLLRVIDEYISSIKQYPLHRDTFTQTDALPSLNPPDLIFIIGESLRSDHLPMNGYHRNTMPLLNTDSTIVSFSNYHTYEAFTHLCIPQMLTAFTPDNRAIAYTSQSFITLFEKSGYSTAWFENQETSIPISYIYFANETDTTFVCIKDVVNSIDTDIIPIFKRWYLNDNKPKLAVIHAAGSHLAYFNHYDQRHRRFIPDGVNKQFFDLTDEELVNSYDNSIIATDEFLHQIINITDNNNTIILYISDHGESLGENGIYMHGRNDLPEQTNPAMLIRPSAKYLIYNPEIFSRIQESRSNHVTPDMIFHTVLYLARIQTEPLDSTKVFINH